MTKIPAGQTVLKTIMRNKKRPYSIVFNIENNGDWRFTSEGKATLVDIHHAIAEKAEDNQLPKGSSWDYISDSERKELRGVRLTVRANAINEFDNISLQIRTLLAKMNVGLGNEFALPVGSSHREV